MTQHRDTELNALRRTHRELKHQPLQQKIMFMPHFSVPMFLYNYDGTYGTEFCKKFQHTLHLEMDWMKLNMPRLLTRQARFSLPFPNVYEKCVSKICTVGIIYWAYILLILLKNKY